MVRIRTNTALTYDDVLIIPRYSEVLPVETHLQSKFSKNIKLNIPLVSAAMDTVTEHQTAIVMAQEGGIGVIHKNLPAEVQAGEVKKVKEYSVSPDYYLTITDAQGRLRVAAACGVSEKEIKRVELLAAAGVDAIVIDTAHGHSKGVVDMLIHCKKNFPHIDFIAGNVATPEACKKLIDSGADGVKIGIGPGSICTTRVIAGVGVPQLQALIDCAQVCHTHNIPYIADGGVKHSGDIVKALSAGASNVMLGSLFAGCDETPGEKVIIDGRAFKAYRGMGSLGAMALGSKDRYGQADILEEKKLVPEGVEGIVPYKGSLRETLHQLVGGVRAGLGYTGSENISELQRNVEFLVISGASIKEGHPHDILITKEAPNYALKF